MKPTAILDVRQFIDEQPLSRYQLLVALMCGALVFMDGFDAQAMGFVAPALTAQLHISRAALGPVISMGLVGMMVGALVGGPVADRFGRKPVLVACSFAFGAFTLLTSTATTLTNSSAELALIISGYLYHNIVCRYPSLISPDAFRPVRFQDQHISTQAWAYLPSFPPQRAKPQATPAARSPDPQRPPAGLPTGSTSGAGARATAPARGCP